MQSPGTGTYCSSGSADGKNDPDSTWSGRPVGVTVCVHGKAIRVIIPRLETEGAMQGQSGLDLRAV